MVSCSVRAFALIISGGLVFGRNILRHLDQDPEVVELALPFMRLVGISVIPMLLFMTLKQFADGLEYTKTAMVLSIAAIPVNIFLNWILIYGNWGFPRLELVGAGYATLITRSLIFIVLMVVILKHNRFRKFVAVRERQWKYNLKTMRELLRIGIPSSIQLGVEVCAFAVSGIIIGTINAVSQAAHQIALSCAAFTFMVSMGLSQAGSIRVSNAFGRGDWSRIREIGKTTLVAALLYGFFCALCFSVFRWQLPLIFNDNTEVVKLSALLLLFAAVFQISDSTQAIGAGLLRGIKDVTLPTILITLAYWVIGLPAGWLFAFHFHMGAAGMWLGLIIGLTLASVFLSSRFREYGSEAGSNSNEIIYDLMLASPLDRSSIKSSIYSIPIESRNRFAGLLGEFPSAERRCSTRLSTPPRLVACLKSFMLLAN